MIFHKTDFYFLNIKMAHLLDINKIRYEIIPMLEEKFGSDLDENYIENYIEGMLCANCRIDEMMKFLSCDDVLQEFICLPDTPDIIYTLTKEGVKKYRFKYNFKISMEENNDITNPLFYPSYCDFNDDFLYTHYIATTTTHYIGLSECFLAVGNVKINEINDFIKINDLIKQDEKQDVIICLIRPS